ncbi:hypothetical protein [Frigoriglobus tundricola]|uniref:hypothetical protein n=1 Tax=Frigoriglobus tundricola TaxID=2774151 RepID=UPI00148E9685|nr:hypothetical protein [Frigoriglobus tundricola]
MRRSLAATEPVLQGGVQFGLEFGDSGLELLVLDEELPNDPMERGNIGRQRGIGSECGGVHATFNTAAGFN